MKVDVIESLLATTEPAELGPLRRGGVWSVSEVVARVEAVCGRYPMGGRSEACLRALALLWHDHLEEGHEIVQDLSGPDAAWVHGIMHRREPDYSNARYWFHRVGQHSALRPLATAATPMLAGKAESVFQLVEGDRWDALAFIDAVASAAHPSAEPEVVRCLRELQRTECRVLARHLAGL